MADEMVTNQQRSAVPYVGAGAILGAGAGYAAISVAKDNNKIRKWAEEPKYKSVEDIVKAMNSKDTFDTSQIPQELRTQYEEISKQISKMNKEDAEIANAMKQRLEEYKKTVKEIKEKAKNGENVKASLNNESKKLKNDIRKLINDKDTKFEIQSKVEEFLNKRNEIIETAKKEGKIKEDGKIPEDVKKVIAEERKKLKDVTNEVRKKYSEKVISGDKTFSIKDALASCKEKIDSRKAIKLKEFECANNIFESLKNVQKLNIGKAAGIIGGSAVVFATLFGLATPKNK